MPSSETSKVSSLPDPPRFDEPKPYVKKPICSACDLPIKNSKSDHTKCSNCKKNYHLNCHFPPPSAPSDKTWKCNRCIEKPSAEKKSQHSSLLETINDEDREIDSFSCDSETVYQASEGMKNRTSFREHTFFKQARIKRFLINISTTFEKN